MALGTIKLERTGDPDHDKLAELLELLSNPPLDEAQAAGGERGVAAMKAVQCLLFAAASAGVLKVGGVEGAAQGALLMILKEMEKFMHKLPGAPTQEEGGLAKAARAWGRSGGAAPVGEPDLMEVLELLKGPKGQGGESF